MEELETLWTRSPIVARIKNPGPSEHLPGSFPKLIRLRQTTHTIPASLTSSVMFG